LGDPAEYADSVFATRLLSADVQGRASKPNVLMTVLKILFVIAPVNFLIAIGPLLVGLIVLLIGWIVGAVILVSPLFLLGRFAYEKPSGIGVADIFLLIAVFALGQILMLAMLFLSRLLSKTVWAWLSWNVAFLRAEPRL
jgi:uncharacterized membrane protein